MLGSAALLAATAVKNYLAAARHQGPRALLRLSGRGRRVRPRSSWYAPATFEDVDIAITWHPAAINRVDDAVSLANTRIDFTLQRAAPRTRRRRRISAAARSTPSS